MEIRIKFTKQIFAVAKLSAIMAMPEETDNINNYLNGDNEEVIDLDTSLIDDKVRNQFAIMLGMFVLAQKARKDDK